MQIKFAGQTRQYKQITPIKLMPPSAKIAPGPEVTANVVVKRNVIV